MDNIAMDIDARIKELEAKEGPANNIYGTYDVVVRDANGNIVSSVEDKPCECFVIGFLKNWYRWLYNGAYLSGSPSPVSINTTYTDGTTSPNGVHAYGMDVFCPDLITCAAALDTRGIVIGSGNTPVTLNDYALESKYTISEFTHGECVYGYPTYYIVDGNVIQSKFLRVFSNLSDNIVPVNEIGIYTLPYGLTYRLGAWWTKTTMIMRDIIPTANVPGHGSIAIAYTLKFNSGV